MNVVEVIPGDISPATMAAATAVPTLLTIPGLCCSGQGHWQTLWEAGRWDCRRIELPDWDDPSPEIWSRAIADALDRLSRPVVLAAHSLGCHALVRWAGSHRPVGAQVTGALLVAPPDIEAPNVDARIARFGPLAQVAFPFTAVLVASSDDPYATLDASRRMAALWGVELVEVGARGHINADSGLGDWPEGRRLARRMGAP